MHNYINIIVLIKEIKMNRIKNGKFEKKKPPNHDAIETMKMKCLFESSRFHSADAIVNGI